MVGIKLQYKLIMLNVLQEKTSLGCYYIYYDSCHIWQI